MNSSTATMAKPTDPLVTSKDIGRVCGVHHRTIELHAQKNLLPHYRIGGSVRFDMVEVLKIIRKEALR
jgi:hypothetical protein